MSLKQWYAGKCKKCGHRVRVCDSSIHGVVDMDYAWICSNIQCTNGKYPECTYDQDTPDWVRFKT